LHVPAWQTSVVQDNPSSVHGVLLATLVQAAVLLAVWQTWQEFDGFSAPDA
jgi:hypothetical protein